ncbi:hypothetical protein ACEWY4_017731 [Coilia grayii]|uniref:C-type lectin domain-containing protein n=1 Tax=Coilia grayii TaxID=363190 RepID=A0ABD1JHP8_9TELE
MATRTIWISACAVLLLCGAAHSHRQQRCSSGWRFFNNRCFKIIPTPTAFYKAEEACQRENAHLASLHTVAENAIMRSLVQGARLDTSGAWIGGADDVSEGHWYWLDGSPFNYIDWAKGQPDNYGNEDCLMLTPYDHLRWNDLRCDNLRPYICAKKSGRGSDGGSDDTELKMTDVSCAPSQPCSYTTGVCG